MVVETAVKKWPRPEDIQPQFPVRECGNCGYFLEDAPAKAMEKGFDTEGRLTWTDHCPQCGTGYAVWTEAGSVPAPEPKPPMMEMTAENSLTEYEMEQETAAPQGRTAPFKGTYYCPKCGKFHMEKSKLGKAHLKHMEAPDATAD